MNSATCAGVKNAVTAYRRPAVTAGTSSPLTDGCAAFREDVHDATLVSLGTVTHQMTCAQVMGMTCDEW